MEGKPVYHDNQRKWDVTINRNGKKVTIHPSHIVLASGTLGEPLVPKLDNLEKFKGVTMHAASYQGGAPFTGKRVVVIGAGNSSVDVCQDLCFQKAASVTMVQRTSTCVVSGATVEHHVLAFWPKGVPAAYGDFKFGTMPLGQVKKLMATQKDVMWESEKEMFAKLQKGGIALNMGSDDSGYISLVWERLGGGSTTSS